MNINNSTALLSNGTELESHGFEFSNYNYRIVAGLVMILMTPIGLIGNGLVIAAVCLSRKLQTTTNVFVVSLAVTDILNCAFFPVQAVSLLTRNGPPQIGPLCAIAGAIMVTTNVTSVLTLLLIALNRCLKITRPIATYQRYYAQKNLAAMLILSWGYPFVVLIIPLVAGVAGELGYSWRYKFCCWEPNQNGQFLNLILACSTVVVCILIISSYIVIGCHVRKHSRKIAPDATRPNVRVAPSVSASVHLINASENQQPHLAQQFRAQQRNARDVKVTKNLAVVVCVFFICVVPYGLCTIIPGSDIPFTLFSFLVLSNSIINPILYAFKHPVFSKVFKCIFKCQLKSVPEPSRSFQANR